MLTALLIPDPIGTVLNPRLIQDVNRRFLAHEPPEAHAQPMAKRRIKTSDLGIRIRERLDHLDKSQDWLAGKCVVSQNAVSKWLRDGKITLTHAVSCARALECSVEYLATGDIGSGHDAIQVGRDWAALLEPLRSQWKSAVHAAAQEARKASKHTTDERVEETFGFPPNHPPKKQKKS